LKNNFLFFFIFQTVTASTNLEKPKDCIINLKWLIKQTHIKKKKKNANKTHIDLSKNWLKKKKQQTRIKKNHANRTHICKQKVINKIKTHKKKSC
jgi:PP-loop superfamily ATP-utilizing enzyme